MEKFIYQEKKGRALVETLEAMSDGVEEMHYPVVLTEQELSDQKTRFAQISISEARLADEKKEFMDLLKERLKPIKTEKTDLLQVIKTGAREEFGRVYKIVDRTEKMTGFYNDRGQLVFSRGATTEELAELTIAHNRRTGTNDN